MANAAEFSAILEHLGLPQKTDYTDAEKLAIYREHKELTRAIQMALSGSVYDYTLRTGQNQGYVINGTITPTGKIIEKNRETSFNT